MERMKSLVVDLLLDMVEEPDCPHHRQSPTAAASAQAQEPDDRSSRAEEQQQQQRQEEPQSRNSCCSCTVPAPAPRRSKTTWRSTASRLAHQQPLSEYNLHLNPYQGLSQRTLDLLDGKDK